MSGRGFDWSAQPSGHTLSDLSAIAVEIARMYLRESGRRDAADLAEAADAELVRRLGLVDGGGRLTNAGSLLFAAAPAVGIDYMRREVPGADSINRVRAAGPLLKQIADVEQACRFANNIHRVMLGFTQARVRSIPSRAVREAILNGVVHRDWLSSQPTTIEHLADQMTVTSPGGFIGGVSPSNIITRPAQPRYPSLADALASLRLAGREGAGVDMMIRHMLAAGLPPPAFSEIGGAYVRVSLFGGPPDPAMLRFVASVEPPVSGADAEPLLVLNHLIHRVWIDSGSAAPVLQRSEAESAAALKRVSGMTGAGHPVIVPVGGVPAGHSPAYRLSDRVREVFAHRPSLAGSPEGREASMIRWARRRGRISSTEAADITGLTVPYCGRLLAGLARAGLLTGSRPNGRGRGFHYLPVDSGAA